MTTCGFIGMSVRVPRSSINLFQLSIRFCAFFRNDLVRLLLDQRQQGAQHAPAISDQSDVRRVAQSNASRIDIDLHGLCLAGLRIKLHVREAGPGDDQRVALLQRVLRGSGAEQADTAGRVGAPVGHNGFSEQWLYDRAANCLAQIQHFLARVQAAAAREDGDLRTLIDDFGCRLQSGVRRDGYAAAYRSELCLGMLADERTSFDGRPFLNVLGNRDVRDRAAGERGLDRFVQNIDYVGWPHDALVVRRHIHKELVQIHVLLIMRADQIVKRMTRDGEHRLPIALRIVKPIEQMHAAGTGGRQTHAELARVFGITTCRECCSFFVADLDEPDFVFARSKRFEDAVDSISRKSEDRLHPPVD